MAPRPGTIRHHPDPTLVFTPLVGPPALFQLRVARVVARSEREVLRSLGSGLHVAHGALADSHGVPLLQVEDLVVELDAGAARDEDVDLLLRRVPVSEGNPEVRLELHVA